MCHPLGPSVGNGGAGIAVRGNSAGNRIRNNSIADNAGLAIDLGADGPTPNDAADADTGANRRQNYPVITNVTRPRDYSEVTADFTLDAEPNRSYLVDLYFSRSPDSRGHGRAERGFGSVTVSTDENGHAAGSLKHYPTPGRIWITAAATQGSNTSELSPAFAYAVPRTTYRPPPPRPPARAPVSATRPQPFNSALDTLTSPRELLV